MKKRFLSGLLAAVLAASSLAACGGGKNTKTNEADTQTEEAKELDGEITFWHSFTQGPRLEVIQKAADNFMQENPKVKINIETFSWGDFYTKWTTGLASGNVPDMSTALPSHVVEMMDSEAVVPLDDLIDSIGRDRFAKTAPAIQYLYTHMRRLCGTERISLKQPILKYRRHGRSLQLLQRLLQRTEYTDALSHAAQMI